VEQLGGIFSVESAPGEGTVVAAQLPAPDVPFDPAAPEEPA
jgi:signal transduction histidine kinase